MHAMEMRMCVESVCGRVNEQIKPRIERDESLSSQNQEAHFFLKPFYLFIDVQREICHPPTTHVTTICLLLLTQSDTHTHSDTLTHHMI